MNMVEGLENQGYIIYTDNFYSSPTLFTDLVNKGFDAVGTIDHTRRGCTSCSWTAEEEDATPGLPEGVWGLD